MAKLPQEPDLDRLLAIKPSIKILDPNQVFHRIYKRGSDFPTSWNTFRYFGPLSRFDHQLVNEQQRPVLQTRGILYAASDIPTAFAESFQYNRRHVNRNRDQPWLASFRFDSALQLLDLTDTFVVRAGASMKLTSGPFTYSQNWARGFYEAYPSIQGIYYFSSLTNRPTIALFERADDGHLFSKATLLHRALADPLMFTAIASVVDEIGYGLS